jgi:hypothetical protein
MEDEPKTHSIKGTFLRLNSILFLVALIGALIFCIIMINQALNQTETADLNQDNVDTSQTVFDEATKAKLLKLKPSSNNSGDQPLPSGRINPFSE